ncbi:MAG TPA: peroxiredoxin-like family protein [Solirubrobacteraceae bacterium]|nr:peroxiredoxin-like family protein [Solirubrobacteraceae bacterium]
MSTTSTTTTEGRAAHGVRPTQPAPDLTVALLRGGTYRLSDQRPTLFTMVVFFRGLHCPVCHAQLSELEHRLAEIEERGIEAIAVSAETPERTSTLAQEWKLERLNLAYGLSEEQMRAWGLFISRAIHEHDPPLFNEPGLFLISPDHTVYYEALLSMPVGRPRLADLLAGIDYWTTHDYPARGEA